MLIRSSAASSDDLLFLGMWLRIWSSMSSPMMLLMDPLAAASLCRTSTHCSSSAQDEAVPPDPPAPLALNELKQIGELQCRRNLLTE
jgi:hypothetical protein